MISYTVELGRRSYPIHIGAGLLERRDLLAPHIAGRALVVCAEPLAELYLARACAALGDVEHRSLVLPDGEGVKTLDTVNTVFDCLLEHRFDRHSTLVALGGGVVGDITGFAAACYQRGVPFVQIPTTLLAQVDSSVGGKTGVNHPLGKNMIGAFHQPACVLADVSTLETLAPREFRSGLAEVIKYGLIADGEFFAWLESNTDALLARDEQALVYAIARSCAIKAEIVAGDEREQGRRAILNYGHTFGHAIETETGYGTWAHGEAVAAGMCMAAALSHRLGWLDETGHARVLDLVARCDLPVAPPQISAERFLEHMSRDKKARGGRIVLVLLRGIGAASVTSDYPRATLTDLLEQQQPAASAS